MTRRLAERRTFDFHRNVSSKADNNYSYSRLHQQKQKSFSWKPTEWSKLVFNCTPNTKCVIHQAKCELPNHTRRWKKQIHVKSFNIFFVYALRALLQDLPAALRQQFLSPLLNGFNWKQFSEIKLWWLAWKCDDGASSESNKILTWSQQNNLLNQMHTQLRENLLKPKHNRKDRETSGRQKEAAA